MTPEKIKEILDRSGYLFEQNVASQIENLGYNVTTNKAYLDSEENKSREIDVFAVKDIFKIETQIPIYGLCYLNCECKNSKTPYVFIKRKKSPNDFSYIPDGIMFIQNDYRITMDSGYVTQVMAFNHLELQKTHFATMTDDKAVQICKIIQNGNKQEAQHSGIIESFIYPLVKSQKVWQAATPMSNANEMVCKFFFNLVVVNSPIFSINSEDEGALPIEEKFVPFIRDIQTASLRGKFIITFVHISYLKDFLEKSIEIFCLEVEKKYRENPKLIGRYQ